MNQPNKKATNTLGEQRQYQVVIIGGGMVGATAAICCARLGLKTLIVEALEPTLDTSPSYDQRAIALSDATVNVYKTLGLWEQISSISTPIKDIFVSEQGQWGTTRLHACEMKIDAFGEVIPLDETGPILWQALSKEPNLTTLCPAKVNEVSLSMDTLTAIVKLNHHGQTLNINAKLVLAADGTYSKVSAMLGIDIERKPYHQHAIIANISTEIPHENRAFERFTSSGPLALLPLSKNRMSLVWCQKDENVGSVMEWSDEEFSNNLQQAFSYRLGHITKVGARFQYPLSLHLPNEVFKNRILLFGNASHTVHPIAGQGFNLGMRDVAGLTDLLADAINEGKDIGADEFLGAFVKARESDWQQTILATDGFARLFANDFVPLALVRNKAMCTINSLKGLKSWLAQSAMGYVGKSPKLTRGIFPKPVSSID